MHWSPQQDRALSAVARWLRARDQPVYRLFGYAGTGKTTLAQHIARDVSGQVLFAAYTGKAAHVMRSKGCRDASTIHSLIYKVEDVLSCPEHSEVEQGGSVSHGAAKCWRCGNTLLPSRRPRFVLNQNSLLSTANLLIVDECSMVGDTVGRHLLSFGVPILVLGDTAQLPPPEGCGFFTAAKPDSMLTEIHRQARDNPIIRMSMIVREGGRLDVGRYGESQVVNVDDDVEIDAEQILVGCNDTRGSFNSRQREELGFAGCLPAVNDKLVCLRNNHARGLLNGSLWAVEAVLKAKGAERMLLLRIKPDEGGADANNSAIEVMVHPAFFCGGRLPQRNSEHDEFDFGYALTVHKSQGSQWKSVLLWDESTRFSYQIRSRWLYTGITRAEERITVVVG